MKRKHPRFFLVRQALVRSMALLIATQWGGANNTEAHFFDIVADVELKEVGLLDGSVMLTTSNQIEIF